LNWGGLPDVAAIGLLICAFASVARRSQSPVSGFWLTGWLMIWLHFVAALFEYAPGVWGYASVILLTFFLIGAGVLFMHASIPYRNDNSSHWMLGTLLAVNAIYIADLCIVPSGHWTLTLTAPLLGLGPLAVAVVSFRRVHHPLRWVVVTLYCSLSIFLLVFQSRPGNGPALAWNAITFTVYLGCCISSFYAHRRATAGAFVTIAGFSFWASVFAAGPILIAFMPQAHIDPEVWNLPKFVVAVGMMLLLLEDQIEHNKHLALHDALTGLPNRRLFEDRMASALERSRRTGTEMALLVIDLDYFKQVNDTLGHHVGDQVLQCVSSIFTERVRRSDTVSRTGGDEFSIILEEPTNREEAENVGKSLRQLLEAPLVLRDHEVQIGASIGIAVYPEDANDVESLCIAADRRMYEAKHYNQRLHEAAPPAKWRAISNRESKIKKETWLAP
jgi:diguanylate cyclase (GGDEF)-like protein